MDGDAATRKSEFGTQRRVLVVDGRSVFAPLSFQHCNVVPRRLTHLTFDSTLCVAGSLSPVPTLRPDGTAEALTVTPAFFAEV
jgi:hypothetical protein